MRKLYFSIKLGITLQKISIHELTGRKITNFNSKDVLLYPLLIKNSPSHVVTMNIEPNGVIGLHQAMTNQLFIVLQGTGWVRGQSDELIPIKEKDWIFWSKDEWHETRSEFGMLALVIESDTFEFLKK